MKLSLKSGKILPQFIIQLYQSGSTPCYVETYQVKLKKWQNFTTVYNSAFMLAQTYISVI
jgi:hypothetical protein